jgi:hypothetical protein
VILRNGTLELDVRPDVGGKISQVRDLRTGRSLLVPARLPLTPLVPGTSWVDYDTSGMDDCFPNIEPGMHPNYGAPLPQLGEWVYGSWQVAASDTHRITLVRQSSLLPYRARKSIEFVEPDTARIDYAVENTGDVPFRYLWSSHPLIAVEQEFELVLPPGPLHFVLYPSDGQDHVWPRYGGVDLSREWIPVGRTLKIFITGLSEGWCHLRLPLHTLRFEFDLAATPCVGIWFNHFGFPAVEAFRCIAVEPCTSPSDALHLLDEAAYPVISPRTTAEWWMTIRTLI